MSATHNYTYANISETDLVGNKQLYISLLSQSLSGRMSSRGLQNASEHTENLVSHMLDYLNTTDFFIAPASLKYHDAFEGGLLFHSLAVYNQLLELVKVSKFAEVDMNSAVLVALTHDWCKIGKYDVYMKNVKNDDGQWEQQIAYKYSEDHMGLGHGTQSLIMLQQFCNTPYTSLTFDEMAAIRYHMYTFDMSTYDQEDMNKCNNSIPLVKLIQFADQLACVRF